jgi:peptidoglycan hydrolase-like protein with peptidoglycan-binding domain
MARGILEALMRNPRGWGMTGLASPEEGVNVPQDPMSPGEAAMKLVQRRVPQEATMENAGSVVGTSLMGPVLGLAGRAPGVATALLGLTHALPAGSEDGDRQGVMNLQRQLKEAGYYTGPIDGLMQGGTRDAKQRFEADQSQKQQLDIERAKAEAAAKGADAATAETARKAAEAEAATKRRLEGEERLRQVETEVSPVRQVLREYGPIAGYAAGLIGGSATRKGVTKLSDMATQKSASVADALMAAPAKDLPGRVSRVNQFWAQGQKPLMSAPEAPFTAAPAAKAGFRPNPDAPQAAELYQPSRVRNGLTDLGIAGTFGAESMVGQELLEPEARAELEKAQEAVNGDPSEVNIERLQSAKDRVAMAEFVKNMGRAGGASYLGSGLKYQRSNTRPNVSAAEAERLRIGQDVKGRSPVTNALMAPAKTGRMKTVAPGVRKSQSGTYHADDGKFVSPPTKK